MEKRVDIFTVDITHKSSKEQITLTQVHTETGFSFIVGFPDFLGVLHEPSRAFVAPEAVDHFGHFRLHCLDGWVEVVDHGLLNRLFEAWNRAVNLCGPRSEVFEVHIVGILGLIELFVLLPLLGPSLEFIVVDSALSLQLL